MWGSYFDGWQIGTMVSRSFNEMISIFVVGHFDDPATSVTRRLMLLYGSIAWAVVVGHQRASVCNERSFSPW